MRRRAAAAAASVEVRGPAEPDLAPPDPPGLPLLLLALERAQPRGPPGGEGASICLLPSNMWKAGGQQAAVRMRMRMRRGGGGVAWR